MSTTTHAGNVAPGRARYNVVDAHDHPTLLNGDTVIMTVTPRQSHNLLLREGDCTLHQLQDQHGQYVHLQPHFQT